MFRFTIRELLLLTLVVAMGVGWALRERQFRGTMQTLKGQANVLEYFLIKDGIVVDWNEKRTMVTIFRQDNPKGGARALYVPAFNADLDPDTGR